MDEDVAKWDKFLIRIWNNKAKMPSLYPETSLTWEAQIYNAFDKAGIGIDVLFANMADDKKPIYGTGTGGWFWNMGEKRSSSS
jgi:hypothetical protein